MIRQCAIWMLILGCPLIIGCGGKGGGGNGNNNHCPQGFRPEGRVCVPIFDDCPGPAEIPVLGGGCQPVGVTECATGFVSDGEGGCDPILPSQPCPPSTMEVIGRTECQPVGVTQFAQGFVSDGEGGFDAILPPGSDPCPFGTMEVLGHTECQPIGDCGTGTWGNITTDATTVFVDQSADATGANGSDASPFTTIADALAVVEPGGQIAVAAGEYVERLVVNHRVHLAGRCAELVTVRGTRYLGQDRPPVTVVAGGSGSTVRGVTLTGDAEGLVINGAQAVTVEEVQVVLTGAIGVEVFNEADATLRRVVVTRCSEMGIVSQGSSLEVFESVVRDTNPAPNGTVGRGVHVQCMTGSGCGSLRMVGSLVAGNRDAGVAAIGVDVRVIDTVVRDTLAQESDGRFGMGILGQCDSDSTNCGSLSVTGSVVAGNRAYGVAAWGVNTDVTSTVVRDTLPQQSDAMAGVGILGGCSADGACDTMNVTGSLVAGNRTVGIITEGVDSAVTSTVVRNTLPQQSDGTGGRGINVQCNGQIGTCGSLTVTGSLVTGNRELGIFASGEDAAIVSTVVRDTLARESDGWGGRGVSAQCHPYLGTCGDLTVFGSLVAGNTQLGIFATGVDAVITSTVVRDTLPQEIDGTGGRGITAQCDVGVGSCGTLAVTGSVVAGNRDVGIFASGVDATITSTVVRDTLPGEAYEDFGRGISAQCYPELEMCGTLTVTASLVAGNEDASIFSTGVHTVLSRTIVRDTMPNDTGTWPGEFGQGIFAVCQYPDQGRLCAVLQMSHCLVESSFAAGVAIQGGSGSMTDCVIRSVSARPVDDAYGYGLQVEGLDVPGAGQTFFDVQSCRILDATLAGVLYVRAQGTVAGSEVGGAGFSIVMNEGASVTVADDNRLSGSYEDEPSWQNMNPSPAPAPQLPTGQ